MGGSENVDLFGPASALHGRHRAGAVAGFVSQVPSGAVVREAVLMQSLPLFFPRMGDVVALVSAVSLRLVWLAAEVVISAILYLGRRIPMLSIVIPVFNEAESLEALHRELGEVAAAQGYELEIIFVDDGSRDGSWEVIRRLAAADPRVRGIRFRRNFGKAAALSAGFAEARGELVMTLDADLQDDPHEIPRFLAEMEKDLDVVSGWKKVRHDPWHKVLPSRVFNWLVSWLTGVRLHDHNCGMKCYRREVLDEVRLYGELHRFVPVLAAGRGFRVGEMVIHHRPRQLRPLEVRRDAGSSRASWTC